MAYSAFEEAPSEKKSDDVGFFESALAGVVNGVVRIPRGFVSLGAELYDLVGDANTAKEVENWFDTNLNPFSEEAEAQTIGKITRAVSQLGIPGVGGAVLGAKIGRFTQASLNEKISKLTQASLTAKKEGKSFSLAQFGAKIATPAGAAIGGGLGEATVADEDIGTFADMLRGTSLEPYAITMMNIEEKEGREEAYRRLLNRVKFGAESSIFNALVLAGGKGISKLRNPSEEGLQEYSENSFKRFFQKYGMPGTVGRQTRETFTAQRAMGANIGAIEFSSYNLTKDFENIVKEAYPEIEKQYLSKSITTSEAVKDAFNDLSKTKLSFYKDPTTSEIDRIGVTFNELNDTIKPKLTQLEDNIFTSAKNNKIKVEIDDKESIQVLNRILQKYSSEVKKELPDITGKKLSAEEMKAYNKQKSVNDLVDLLNEYGHSDLVKRQLKILKKGVINLDTLSFNEAVTLRSLIRNAEREAPGDLKNAFTKVKGTFNKAIDDATKGFDDTKTLVNQYDDLLFNYRGSYLEDLTKQFGYGDSSRVLKPLQLVGNNRNAFQAFVNNTNESLNNSEKLGNILKGKIVTVNQRNRIESALYENYYNKVFPETAGGAGQISHKQFIDQFGDNYKLILGDEKFSKFANSQKSALNTYQKFIDNQVRIQKVVSDKLPTLNINTLELGDANAIVREIFLNGNKADVSGLITGLKKIDPAIVEDIKKIYLRTFLNGVKTDMTVPGGKGRFASLDGRKLDEFLNNNKSIVEQMFGKEFLSAHRDIAKALTLIQTDTLAGKAGSPGLTEAANKAGLFVDIFAGPLNHKRLILNRIGRIYDGFDLGGDSLALLRDYDRFVEAAKSHYLGGNYPKVLDKLGESTKPKDKELYKRFFKAMTPYKGFEIAGPLKLIKNPLTAKEYIKDKIENKRLPGETGVFTPIDEVIGSIIGTRGETVPKFLARNINPKIEKLVSNIMEAIKLRGKETSESIKRKEFEKKLAK